MADILSSFQHNLAVLEGYASGLSDDKKIELQEKVAEEARKTNNVKISVDQIKELGKTAISTDSAFVTVSRAFEQFVKDYGTTFPKTKEFLTKWNVHHEAWKKLLRESRDFASATSGEYKRYDEVYLNFIQKMKDKDDLDEAIAGLTRFSNNKKIEIPMDYADKFKELGEQIKFFREDFDKYLKDQGKELTAKVKELQEKLKVAEDTAKRCDQIIRDTAKYVEFIPFIGFFAKEITEACMPDTVNKRNKAQADAKLYKTQIDEANKAQQGLAQMQTQFAALDSEFQIICGALAIFANTWAYFHSEALKFANSMKGYDNVKDLPRIFKSEVDLSRAIAKPLQEGLDAYSQVIV